MAIVPKIQRPAGSNQPVVAAGETFVVALTSNLPVETGKLSVSVGGTAREFALAPGGGKAKEQDILADPSATEHIHDWGTAADAGQKVVVAVKAGNTTNDDTAPIV